MSTTAELYPKKALSKFKWDIGEEGGATGQLSEPQRRLGCFMSAQQEAIGDQENKHVNPGLGILYAATGSCIFPCQGFLATGY